MKHAINRREFLKFGASATVLPGFVTPKGGNSLDIPSWAQNEIDVAVNRFERWKRDDEVVAFVFLTDVHSCLESMPQSPDFSDSRFHALFAQVAADQARCDFIVDGGDHDYERGQQSDEALQKRMAVTESIYSGCMSRPVLFCLGNHDHGAARKGAIGRPISSAMFGERFNGLAVRHGHRIMFGENRSWGYYDIPNKKFRAIFVNTSDDGYFGFSTSQLEFLAKSLASLPDGWVVALFGHYCVLNEIGHWKQYETDCATRKQEFISILKSFVNRRPNDLVGYFCGDSHFDNEQEWEGINWTISQGYGGIDRANFPWGAQRTEFSRKENMLFELVAVKPAIGEFKIFRVGAGGANRDRKCCFHNKFA